MGRFVQSFLIRMLPLMLGKDLILFPQTYGPFKRALSRSMARYVLRRSRRIYSRDQAGLDFVKELLKHIDSQDRIAFAPDVALLLEPRRPAVLDVEGLDAAQDGALTTVGLNVSGLIYYGGYRGGNEFGIAGRVQRAGGPPSWYGCCRRKVFGSVLVPHVIPRTYTKATSITIWPRASTCTGGSRFGIPEGCSWREGPTTRARSSTSLGCAISSLGRGCTRALPRCRSTSRPSGSPTARSSKGFSRLLALRIWSRT